MLLHEQSLEHPCAVLMAKDLLLQIIMRTRESIDNEAQKFVETSTIQREILDQTQLMKLV